MTKLPEPASTGDDDIPDFLRGVMGADENPAPAKT